MWKTRRARTSLAFVCNWFVACARERWEGRANSNWLNQTCGTSVAALTTVECIFGGCIGESSAVEHNPAGQLQSNRLLVKQSPCVVNLLRFTVTTIRCEPTDLTIPRLIQFLSFHTHHHFDGVFSRKDNASANEHRVSSTIDSPRRQIHVLQLFVIVCVCVCVLRLNCLLGETMSPLMARGTLRFSAVT